MYENLVIRLREAIPEISITTDIIVGFPGERKEDFEDTLDMVRRIRFDGAFTFAYSPLAGTKAFKFDNQVPDEVKSKRLCELIDVQKRITEEKNQYLVGKEFEVLVEGVSVKNPEELQGRIRQNKIIVFKGEKDLIGKLVNVKVLRAGCWASRGERIIC
ncbi:TRAM domain-containing protein [Patescibacteria group bacterium]|nr:TRAM domain-containing protein [Patescibacteria group bacterium]